MLRSNRRTFVHGSMATAGALWLPKRLRAQGAGGGTLRAVMHGDIGSFDPIWTTANMTAYHGAMIYDTLFALDESMTPQPQMVSRWEVSDDRLTYTFELRDGLAFSDGSPVTSRDVVASIKRWAARDGAGQHMMQRVKEIRAGDEKTFVIELAEPYGLVIDIMAKTSTPLLYIMREAEAETDPMEQVTEYIGSGPFVFNREETRQGAQYVYDKNPNYVPRDEPASGMAGGKIVHLDRVIFENIGDSQTAMAALQAGEIDFMETPPLDLIEVLEMDENITVEVLSQTGNVGWLRMNFLHPPFDNVKARQAMLHLLDQEEFMQATFGNPNYYRECASNFACGTPMENDANTEWFERAPDPERAKELFVEAGYDGQPITILHATNIDFMNNSAQIIAQRLREIGINAELATSDWGGVVTRRAVMDPPEDGGWNLFITWAGGASVGNPIALAGHAANGRDGWFGWPSDERHEELRDEWATADGTEAQLEVARQIQENAWNFVPHVWLGQWVAPVAYRSNLEGVLKIPEIVPFWNIERV
jgi:peptide/nickel transport system substrate-binding protein